MASPTQKAAWTVLSLAVFFALALGSWRFHEKENEIHRTVVFYRGDQATEFSTTASTVGGALSQSGVTLRPEDVVAPFPSTPVTEGMEIDLGLVEGKVKEYKKIVPFASQIDYTDTLNAGEIIDVVQGKDGLEDLTTQTFFLNGVQAFEKTLKSTVLVPAKNAKVLEGTALRTKLYPLRKRARVWKTLTLEATAYYPGPEDTWPYASGTTASGLKAGYGVAAVDPRLIRLKTPLYIEGYGYALAADKGGAIKGSKIDLCFDTYEEAVRFGRKKVKVYILR